MPMLVAVSGGVDSMVLLDVLVRVGGSYPLRLVVGHVNHGLRGPASDADEALVRDFALTHSLPFYSARLTEAEIAEIKQGNLEEKARSVRYRYLLSMAACHDCQSILTAHSKSDQAETVLLRLIRSTGLTGLCGIRPVLTMDKTDIARPLLHVTREEITAYAKQAGVPYLQDAMNDDTAYTRVRIRKELMPALQEHFNPGMATALANLSDIVREEEAYWERTIGFLARLVGWATLESPGDRLLFVDCSKAEQRRLLRYYCERHGLELSFKHIESAVDLLRAGAPQSELHLASGVHLYRRYNRFYFSSPIAAEDNAERYRVAINAVTALPMFGAALRVEAGRREELDTRLEPGACVIVDRDCLQGEMMVRSRNAGDRIFPLGLQGSKKVKKILQEQRIEKEERARIPLVCAGDEIIWIAGICLSDTVKVTDATRHVLRLTLEPLEPGDAVQ
jgi:tRNA(Ile)-lysidine synthase